MSQINGKNPSNLRFFGRLNLNVLLLTSSYPIPGHESWAPFVKDKVLALAEKGNKMTVMVFSPENRFEEFQEKENIRVVVYPYFCIGKPSLHRQPGLMPSIQHSIWALIQFPFYIAASVYYVFKELNQHSYDLIHALWYLPMGWVGALAKKIFKIPLVVTGLGGDFYLPNNFFIKFLLKWVSAQADINTICSHHLMKRAKNYGIDSSHFKLISNGVLKKAFLPRDKKIKEKIQIAFMRRLVPEKNPGDFLQALSLISDLDCFEIKMFGEGPLRAHLENMAQEFNLKNKIDFINPIPHEKMPQFLSETDIFVDTSTQEGISCGTLEALAACCIVIAPQGMGNSEMIEHGINGYLYSPRDTRELSRLIQEKAKKILKKPFDSQQICLAEQFDLDYLVKEWQEAYDFAVRV